LGGGCGGPYYAELADADFTSADARGARNLDNLLFEGAGTTNLIWPDGHIEGLDLVKSDLLVIRDYDGNSTILTWWFTPPPTTDPPTHISIDQHLTMGPGGTLRMVFDADSWNSTISFAPGISVTLGGTLELLFDGDVNLASQIGRTFDLFDWTGVNPTGAFNVISPYAWELSNLYTTGEVTLISVPEPRALFLLSFALCALVAMRRVRLSSNSAIGGNL
jgi:hypothetical protein